MGDNEAGVEPGDPILDAVADAFGPRPPAYVPPGTVSSRQAEKRPGASPPGRDHPVALRPGHEAAAAGPSRVPSLFGPTSAERRDRLAKLVARGIAAGEIHAVGQVLTSDPDPDVRWLAARGLAGGGYRLPLPVLARALADPEDRVRREVVPLVTARGAEALRLLLPAATDRRAPMTQMKALDVLPEVVRGVGRVEPADLAAVLVGVASLDPPPLPAERSGLGALARAIGIQELVRSLEGRDLRRLGAARLLSLSGLEEADPVLAQLQDDPSAEIRQIARTAGHSLALSEGGPGMTTEPRPAGAARHGQSAPGAGPPAHAESLVIASLARALLDPDEGVRAEARTALGRVPRALVADWTVQAVERGDDDLSAVAARVAGLLRLEMAAPALLARAAAGPPDTRGPFLEALRATNLDPAELTRLVSVVGPAHRQSAVRLAWQIGGTALLPHLPALLGDSAGPVRMAVIEILSESGDPAAAGLARERLEVDSSAAVRATAIHALARAEPAARQEALTRALADPDPDVRATAVEALTSDVEKTADLLAPAFRDADERVWRASLPHLVALPDQDLVVVWEALREGPPAKREELVRVIEALDPDRLIDLAASNARAASPADRVLAIELAARAGSAEAADLVLAALEDPDPVVRRTSAAAMTTLRAPAAVPALGHSLSDPQVEVRIEAIRALGLIDDDTVPDILIAALRDPEVRVRETAADALARWHSPAVARRLAAALAAPDLRRSAADVLERMGDMATEALAAVAGGPDQEAAAAAGELLERVVGPRPFVDQLASIEPDRRLQAVQVLARIGGPAAAEALVSALSDPDVGVRSLAATSLGEMGYLPALKRLRRMFLTDPVGEAAQAAEAALRGLGVVPTDPDSSPPRAGPGDDLPSEG